MAGTDSNIQKELIARAREGDRQAFSELARQAMKPLVALTYRMTGDPDTAKDLAQESLVAAWKNLSGFRGDAKFESWLYRIATNRTLNFLQSRKSSAATELNESMAAPTASPEVDAHRSELRQGVLEFMATLPPQQRNVFDLRFYLELKFSEIAEVTGQALGTVKTHYREAVKKLRVYAAERGWEQ